jgi:hypothetical protein
MRTAEARTIRGRFAVAAMQLALLFAAPAALAFQEEDPAKAKDAEDGADAEPRKKDKEKKSEIKPYDTVIPSDAITRKGLFTVHRVDDKIFWEIPREKLGGELLWVTQVARTQAGFGLGGTPGQDRVIRLELRDEKLLLRAVRLTIRTGADDEVREAVDNTSVEPILRAFPVKAWGKDQAPVVDVTDLFLTDSPEFGAGKTLGASGAEKDRTFLEELKAFPTNVETKVTMTFKAGDRRGGFFGASDSSLSVFTALIHHSIIELPTDPMRPREVDSRIGYFSVGFDEFSGAEHRVKPRRYVTRWRLEKKDPNAELSDPVKPIVFYVGREVPEKWRPYLRKGIEMWQPAFEAAGFSNAILAKDAPSRRDDPDWDAEDARYSTIRWLPSTIENAMGPHVNDPRTGEIIEADILVFHNLLRLLTSWYFVQCAPLDERAQKLPLPDDLLGELLAYVVAHEVGHSLGLRHNMKASSAYTVEQLRSKEFTATHGTEASIMDYGRFNYVAQPGDGAHLIPVIGPYDRFAIEWGYRQFKDSKSRQDDEPLLDAIAARQNQDPMLRFGDPNPGEDPSQQTEDLGSDPVLATELGIANLKRVAEMLVTATTEPGDDFELLRDMYGQLVGQLDRELGHVAALVGGLVGRDIRQGDGERIFEPVPAEQQRKAVAFLVSQLLETPEWLIRGEILDRIETNGAAGRLLASQRRVLSSLFSRNRLGRMAEHVERAVAGSATYAPADLLLDLRQAVFRELSERPARATLNRRNLHRVWLSMLIERARSKDAGNDDAGLARLELVAIRDLAQGALGAVQDDRTLRAHLLAMVAEVDAALDPSK